MASLRALLALLSLTAQLATAWPFISPYAKIVERQEVQEEYNYVIVGGGTSALTVGDRLSADGKYSVLAIEIGKFDDATGMSPSRMFDITSQPQPNLNNREFYVGIGKVVGGSSNVNGMVFLRGTKEEYDIWAELGGGNSTWNWDGLLPYFKKGIYFTPPDAAVAAEFNVTYDPNVWGQEPDTHIYATFSNVFTGQMKTLYNAMRAMPGVEVPLDGSGGTNGLFWYTTSMDPSTFERSYARTGHWDGLNRDNYELLVEHKVNKIVFDGDVATGVQYVPANGGQAATVRARKEVILAAGTVHTPQVLMLSGIGGADLLGQANIEVKVDLPGVGNNFQDHSYIPSIGYQWGTTPPTPPVNVPIPSGGTNPNLGTFIGLPAISPERFEELASEYEAQDPNQYLPEGYDATLREGYKQQHRLWSQAMRSNGVTFLEYMMSGWPGGSVQNLHCASRGTILIDPANPEGEMIVDYRAGTNPIDISVMVENIKFMRRFMTTGELAQYQAVETSPGASYTTDEQLAEWSRGQIIPSVFHPVGTAAKMPREWGGVVDEELLVYGVKQLSVIDASIMPTTVGATTSMTVYAVAEKAADLIKARA